MEGEEFSEFFVRGRGHDISIVGLCGLGGVTGVEEVLDTAVRRGLLWGRLWDCFAQMTDPHAVCLGVVGAVLGKMLAGVKFLFEGVFRVFTNGFGLGGYKGRCEADCAG